MLKNLSLGLWLSATAALLNGSCKKNDTSNTENAPKTDLASVQPLKDKTFTIAFYNVENLFDLNDDPQKADEDFLPDGKNQWTEERYQDKLKKLAEVIKQLGDENGPEVLGLCEIENLKVLQDLVAEGQIKQHQYQIAHFESPDHRGIDVALLYKPSAFELKEAKTYSLTFEEKDYTSRDILVVKGLLAGKDEYVFVVNHWPSRRGGEQESEGKRKIAAAQARKAVNEALASNPEAKIILMGDFNDEPDNESIVEVLGAKEQANGKDLFNATGQLKKKGIGSYKHQENWNMLDQMILSPAALSGKGFRYKEASVAVFSPEWLKQQSPEKYKGSPMRTYAGTKYLGGYSDHFPVYLHLEK